MRPCPLLFQTTHHLLAGSNSGARGGCSDHGGMLAAAVRDDPGMRDPLGWWQGAQAALTADLHLPELGPMDVGLLVQRVVIVAMATPVWRMGHAFEGLLLADPSSLVWPSQDIVLPPQGVCHTRLRTFKCCHAMRTTRQQYRIGISHL
jgi:hypothetical protein